MFILYRTLLQFHINKVDIVSYSINIENIECMNLPNNANRFEHANGYALIVMHIGTYAYSPNYFIYLYTFGGVKLYAFQNIYTSLCGYVVDTNKSFTILPFCSILNNSNNNINNNI